MTPSITKEQREDADGTMYDLGFINATAGKYATGLTKRELFAAMAMQGMWANPDENVIAWTYEQMAALAVDSANALIAQLNPSKGEG